MPKRVHLKSEERPGWDEAGYPVPVRVRSVVSVVAARRALDPARPAA